MSNRKFENKPEDIVIVSGARTAVGKFGGSLKTLSAIDMGSISDGGILTTLAFDQIPVLGPVILVVGIISFAFSTVLGWSYYGERCLEYLVGSKGQFFYRVVYVAVAAISPVVALNLVWTVADTLNALMAIPNLIAVLLLSGVVVRETNLYLQDLDKRCDDPVPVVDR